MTPGRLAIVLVGFLGLALGVPAPADAARVLMFYSSRYVDTEDNHGAQEAVNLRAALAALGHTVTTTFGPNDPVGICDTDPQGNPLSQPGTVLATAAQYSAGLANADVFLIPEQESFCNLPGELLDHPDVAAVWRNWVTNGGGLVIHSSNEARGKVTDLLSTVFFIQVPNPVNGNGVTTSKRPAAASTQFAAGPATLPGNDSTGMLRMASLPANAISIYDNGTFASVVIVPFGAGKIVFLGWDWTESNPPHNPGLNGGWYPTILDGAVKEASARTASGSSLLATGTGPGGGPHVRLFHVQSGSITVLGPGFLAYDPAFTGGVSVALADLDGDGTPEVATGAGPGGGPHVRLFRVNPSTGQVTPLGPGFFAYDVNFLGGVTVEALDVDGDGRAEIVTAPGPGGGPHVRIFKIDPGTGAATAFDGGGFFAYDAGFRGGVSVAAE